MFATTLLQSWHWFGGFGEAAGQMLQDAPGWEHVSCGERTGAELQLQARAGWAARAMHQAGQPGPNPGSSSRQTSARHLGPVTQHLCRVQGLYGRLVTSTSGRARRQAAWNPPLWVLHPVCYCRKALYCRSSWGQVKIQVPLAAGGCAAALVQEGPDTHRWPH